MSAVRSSGVVGANVDTVQTDEYMSRPNDHGFLAWTGHPYTAFTTLTPNVGQGYYWRVFIPTTITVASITTVHSTAGVGNANTFFGLFDSGGIRRGVTADMSVALQSAVPTGGLVTTVTVDTNQSLTFTGGAGAYLYIGFVVGTLGGTPVVWRGHSPTTSIPNIGFSAAPFMAGNIGSGLSALPTSITPSSMTAATGAHMVGLK